MTASATLDGAARRALIGILAGGAGTRMGGVDKARLHAPSGEELLARLLRVCAELSLEAVVLGGPPRAGARVLPDEPPDIGPIGGLCALLAHAGARPGVLLSCDLPYLSPPLLARLLTAPSASPVLAARDPESGKWQPMFARYDASRVLPALRGAIASGTRSFQTFLRTQDVAELPLDASERSQLRDWDSPGDLR